LCHASFDLLMGVNAHVLNVVARYHAPDEGARSQHLRVDCASNRGT